MDEQHHFKLGDLVVNEWASQDNPLRTMLVLRDTGKRVVCVALDGTLIEYRRDSNLRLTLCGTLELELWRSLAKMPEVK